MRNRSYYSKSSGTRGMRTSACRPWKRKSGREASMMGNLLHKEQVEEAAGL